MSRERVHIEQLRNYHWPSGIDSWIGSLGVRFADLASRIGLHTDRWEEEGLGPAVGALCRLSSGTVILLKELEFAVTYHGARGPEMSADLGEVAEQGVETIRSQALLALGLTDADVIAQPPSDADEQAREFLGHLKHRRVSSSDSRG